MRIHSPHGQNLAVNIVFLNYVEPSINRLAVQFALCDLPGIVLEEDRPKTEGRVEYGISFVVDHPAAAEAYLKDLRKRARELGFGFIFVGIQSQETGTPIVVQQSLLENLVDVCDGFRFPRLAQCLEKMAS